MLIRNLSSQRLPFTRRIKPLPCSSSITTITTSTITRQQQALLLIHLLLWSLITSLCAARVILRRAKIVWLKKNTLIS